MNYPKIKIQGLINPSVAETVRHGEKDGVPS